VGSRGLAQAFSRYVGIDYSGAETSLRQPEGLAADLMRLILPQASRGVVRCIDFEAMPRRGEKTIRDVNTFTLVPTGSCFSRLRIT